MPDEFVPDPDCNCAACQLARLKAQIRASKPPEPQSQPKSRRTAPQRAPVAPGLPDAWQYAIAAAVNLGMLKRSAEQLAETLAPQHPDATDDEALRLMFSSN